MGELGGGEVGRGNGGGEEGLLRIITHHLCFKGRRGAGRLWFLPLGLACDFLPHFQADMGTGTLHR